MLETSLTRLPIFFFSFNFSIIGFILVESNGCIFKLEKFRASMPYIVALACPHKLIRSLFWDDFS